MRGALIFFAIIGCRLLGALINIIDDCDETYNYWEPVHYLIYGSGYQTWEMSSEHALRSWMFPYVASIVSLVIPSTISKYTTWLLIRACIGFVAGTSEYVLHQVGVRHVWGDSVANYSTILSLLSPGIFSASTALLPNTVSMICFNFAFAALFSQWDGFALTFAAASVLFGVPFTGIMIVPMALYIIARNGFLKTFFKAFCVGGVMLLAQILLDWKYYGKLTCALCNLVFYNALSSETDSTLYGVEPGSFYIKNLLLNMNLILPLAAFGALALIYGRKWTLVKFSVIPAALWLVLMFYLPHKESRFLYPTYSFFIICAAVSLAIFWRKLTVLVLIIIFALSVSRITAVQVHYGAPRDAFVSLAADEWGWFGEKTNPQMQHVRLCLGGEWHQFPSSFILPSSRFEMHFVRSSFDGLLPKPFGNSSQAPALGMNRLNKMDENHPFLRLDQCHYFVDSKFPGRNTTWALLDSFPVVDQSVGGALFRSFFIPVLSRKRVRFRPYNIYKRVFPVGSI